MLRLAQARRILLVALWSGPATAFAVQSTPSANMDMEQKETTQLPPEIMRHLKGAPPESRQFDFLLGAWKVAGTRYKPDGSVLMNYAGSWCAKSLNDGRMIMDDFKVHAPDGQAVSSYVTLRTYSEMTRRWEITGLAALQPAMNAAWHGEWHDGEMRLQAVGRDPAGVQIKNRIRFFNIGKDRFDWESRISRDDGATWVLAASVAASRTGPGTANYCMNGM
jgi:hypothetical protein